MMYVLTLEKEHVNYFKLILPKEKQFEIISHLKHTNKRVFVENFPIGFSLPKECIDSFLDYLYDDFSSFSFDLDEIEQEDIFTIKNLVTKIKNGMQRNASPVFSEQIVPYLNHPTFKNGNRFYLWKHELGLFQVLNHEKKTLGFIDSQTHYLIGKTLNQVYDFKKQIRKMKEIEDNKFYVRVISVYSKSTDELKYRILNTEFNNSGFAFHNLKPIEGDEHIYLMSYEITKEIANDYVLWTELPLEFNFEKHRYFFETLNADAFSFPYNELLKLAEE